MSYGNGLSLDENLDLIITNGDLDSDSEIAELQKDLAYRLIKVLDDAIGKPFDRGFEKELSDEVTTELLEDQRVSAVPDTEFVAQPRRDRLVVGVRVQTVEDEEFEQVEVI
jgi:hypothetical protein